MVCVLITTLSESTSKPVSDKIKDITKSNLPFCLNSIERFFNMIVVFNDNVSKHKLLYRKLNV
jgi:hypothetical protein